MNIIYRTDCIPSAKEVINLYTDAGLPRPTNDAERIKKMFAHSNLVVTAWDGEVLIGVSRCLTDFSWCCYLADLAVRSDYMKKGIGKKLIEISKEKAGEQSMVLLLSVPAAMDYYPKTGMEKVENGFIFQRRL
jgi:N-acetylglutamate synthase-like GNAT family acetyltransferase